MTEIIFMSIIWAASMCGAIYELTGERKCHSLIFDCKRVAVLVAILSTSVLILVLYAHWFHDPASQVGGEVP